MATIPIEVIVQDKASPEPTPTPSDSGETNIVVPDTGVGTVENGSNGGGIGSAVSIILPAIILVLAIGTIAAIMVHRYQKRKKANDGIKEYDTKESKRTVSRKEKLATVASGTIAILAVTVLVGNLVIPATKAATNVEPGTAELDTVDKITITATREIDSDITVATVKNTSYATANLDFGYKVTASMAEGLDSANLYLDGDETSEYYIAPVSGSTLADNTWGYTLAEPSEGTSTTYLPIPLEETPATITKGNDMVEDEAADIYYTIKVDKDLPAGSYIGELEYNISPAVEYMQDFATMTKEEKTATLASMPEGEQYILKDIRDKKPYYISKLADGNVWMTQNLDLDIDENTTYTHVDTDLGWNNSTSFDISATWKPGEGHSTINFTGDTAEGWVSSTTAPYSADPGDVYYYTSGTDANDIKYDSLEKCEVEHSDDTCQHYHAGNYYNWSAAVASNDTSEMTEPYSNAPDSICPAGWRLPSEAKGGDGTMTNNEFGELLFKYDVVTTIESPSYAQDGFRKLRSSPLFFNLDGYIWSGRVDLTGSFGNYQVNVVSGNYVLFLSFQRSSITIVSTGGPGWSKAMGMPIRCVL